MRNRTNRNSLITLALAAGLTLAVAGCASSGYQQGTKAAETIQAAANRIGAMPGRIDQTLGALNDLVEKPQPDLQPQFKAFNAQLAGMVSEGQAVAAARQKMATQTKEFFATWDEQLAQIQNEDIKARSQSRKEEVAQKLLAIKRNYSECEMAFRPFLRDLQDVQKYLSVDLTTGGVAAMKTTAGKASQHAAPLKSDLTSLADGFRALGVAMSASTPAPAK